VQNTILSFSKFQAVGTWLEFPMLNHIDLQNFHMENPSSRKILWKIGLSLWTPYVSFSIVQFGPCVTRKEVVRTLIQPRVLDMSVSTDLVWRHPISIAWRLHGFLLSCVQGWRWRRLALMKHAQLRCRDGGFWIGLDRHWTFWRSFWKKQRTLGGGRIRSLKRRREFLGGNVEDRTECKR